MIRKKIIANKSFTCLTVFFVLLIGLHLPAFSQNFDYRNEESAAISWNGVILHDARMMSTGGISLLSAGPFSAIANPALLARYDHFTLGGSLEFMYFQAFQYWGVNQGVLKASNGLDDKNVRISGFSIIIPLKSFHLSMGWYLSDILEFPDFDQDDQAWGYSGAFEGKEDRFFLCVAAQLATGFRLGARLEYGSGQRSVDMIEHFYFEGGYYSIIEQQESHRSRSMSLSVGLTVSISRKWELGAVFDYAFYGKVDRSVDRIFESNFPSPSIYDHQSSQDNHHIPAKIKLATSYLIWQKKSMKTDKKIILAAEVMMVFWSAYEYEFFQEKLDRDMRDTLVAALGIEYGCHGERYDYFLRAGYRLDPQPLLEPATTIHAFCGGVGVRWKRFSGDLGMAFFTGSIGNYSQSHFILSTTLGYDLKGEK
jgi:hypothetical protein